MAARQEAVNDSLETSVDKALKEEQRKRVDKLSQETPRRRKSPFAGATRTSHSPRPLPVKPRPSDSDQVLSSRPRYQEDVPRRPEPVEEVPRLEQVQTVEENYCLSVTLSVLTVMALGVVFLYSWFSANAVK